MYVGILTLALRIDGADSLKDKRQVVKSLLAHLRQKFNVSAAEVDDQDVWRRAVVGVSVVSNEVKFANQVLSKVVDHVERDANVVLDDYAIEITQSGAQIVETDIEDVSDLFV